MGFGVCLKELRERQGVSQAQLGEGICTRQELYRVEKGEWEPDYLLREVFLGRLGIGAEDYEYLLSSEEAAHLEKRTQILEAVLWDRREEAAALLEEYANNYIYPFRPGCMEPEQVWEKKLPTVIRLARQFYLGMLGQLKKGSASREELYDIYRRGAGLTVPKLGEKPLGDLALSFAELDLILEKERYREGGARPEYLLEVVEYAERIFPEGQGRVKIYPKAVYALFCCLEESEGEPSERLRVERDRILWEHCQSSLRVLLHNGKMYYLWELLEMKRRLLERKLVRFVRQKNWMASDIETQLAENRVRQDVLEQVYGRFQAARHMENNCYLYLSGGIRRINQVVRARRRMLEMTREELCQGICSLDTLRRLEEKKTVPQRGIVRGLLRRMGLSGEYAGTDLDTDSYRARELMEKAEERLYKGYWDDAEMFLSQLENLIDMNMPWNRQALLSRTAIIRWKRREIDSEQYCRLQREALELTMPLAAFLRQGEKFMTWQEQSCIRNMMQGMYREEEEFSVYVRRFQEYYTVCEKGETLKAMEGLYGLDAETEWKNRTRSHREEWLNEAVIPGCLRRRRLRGLAQALYIRLQMYEGLKRNIPEEQSRELQEEVRRCLVLCEMAGDRNRALFYQRKLEQQNP